MATLPSPPPSTADDVSPCSGDRAWLTKHTTTEAGTVTKMTASFDYSVLETGGAGMSAKAIIYADSGGNPGARLGVSDAQAIGAGDQTVDFTGGTIGIALAASTTYWLGIVCDSFQQIINASARSGGNSCRLDPLSYASPDDPAPAPAASDNTIFTIYATYTLGGAVRGPMPMPLNRIVVM